MFLDSLSLITHSLSNVTSHHTRGFTQASLDTLPFYLHLATTTSHAPFRHPSQFDPLVAYLDVANNHVVLPEIPLAHQPSRKNVQRRYEQVRVLVLLHSFRALTTKHPCAWMVAMQKQEIASRFPPPEVRVQQGSAAMILEARPLCVHLTDAT